LSKRFCSAERGRLAAELKAIYPDFAQRFRDVMTRISSCDNEVAIANRNLPRGRMPLADVETVARGVTDIGTGSNPISRLSTTVVLPGWDSAIYAWPLSWRIGG
jgi:hypothetical protein